jgi:hypothetical protein
MRLRSWRGLVEGLRGTGLMFTRARSRIKTARPLPRIFVTRTADAARDRAGEDIAIINAPAVLAFGIASAGEGGHPP